MDAPAGLHSSADTDAADTAVALSALPPFATLAVSPSSPTAAAAAAPAAGPPASYLLVATLNKRLNIGMSVRSAVAFGCAEVLVAGNRDVSTFGDQGTLRHTRLRHFDRLRDAVAWCRSRGITVCGMEICEGAQPVQMHPFLGPTAFLAGSEGGGLDAAHKALCDHFVYVPQHGNGTASLNVTVATSIVLHHFATWAAYAEAPREAARDKYAVEPPPQKRGPSGDVDEAKAEARRRAREEEVEEVEGGGGNGDGGEMGLWGGGEDGEDGGEE